MQPDGSCGLKEQSGPRINDDEIEEKYERELIQKEQQNSKYQAYLKAKYRKKLKGAQW